MPELGPVPHVLVGNEASPLKTNIMRPFPGDCRPDQSLLHPDETRPGVYGADGMRTKSILRYGDYDCDKGIDSPQNIWSQRPYFHDHALSKIMTLQRFFWIMRYIHFTDNTQIPEAPNTDKLYKLCSVINHFKAVFPENYNLSQHIAIDEAMVKFIGRHSGRQYDYSKPIKRGFKIWTLADSITGYVYNLNVYLGRHEDQNNHQLRLKAVKNLITDNLHNLYHHLYCDRFFTSIPLMKDLKDIGMYCCGTVRRNRKGLNQELNNMKANKDNIERDVLFFHQTTTDSANMHRKTNSSAHSSDLPLTAVTRTIDKQGTRREIPCPLAVCDYNKYMGGV